jgi:MFS family permease
MTPAPVADDRAAPSHVDSGYAWLRLAVALLLSTIGGIGMWSVVVALPAVQADFGVARGAASLPYTVTMLCFGFAGIFMGRLSDRRGVVFAVTAGTVALSLGYVLAGLAPSIAQFTLVQGLLIGVGSSATFAPLLADTSQWFEKRRGMALGIFASGNYLAGAVWPPIVQHFIETAGWRVTYVGIGLCCAASMLALVGMLRRRLPPEAETHSAPGPTAHRPSRPLAIAPGPLQALLVLAAAACCVAMAMPQVHLVAYSGDLGHGVAHGAHMLSLLFACGVVSRLAFGWISDRTGGLPTLILGSALQTLALLLFLPFSSLASLYVVSAVFGLAQGGIVPSYAMIVRENFAPAEAGARIGAVMMASVTGMALGGWMSGAIFDLTGSYRAAFVNGVLWNVLNLSIALFLMARPGRRPLPA